MLSITTAYFSDVNQIKTWECIKETDPFARHLSTYEKFDECDIGNSGREISSNLALGDFHLAGPMKVHLGK
jgi:hypothetical protein